MSSEYGGEYFKSRRMGRVLTDPHTIHDRRDSYACGLPALLPLSPDLQVLDIGCGLGQGAWWMSRRCRQVIGVDGSKFAIDFATRTYREANLRYLWGDVLSVDLQEARFDLILIMDLLEHMEAEDQRRLLGRCRGWLDSRGRLLVHTPIGDSHAARWNHRRRTCATLDGTGDPTHRSILSVRSLHQLMAECGFAVEREKFTYSRFVLSRGTVRFLGRCLGFLPTVRNELVQGIYLLAR